MAKRMEHPLVKPEPPKRELSPEHLAKMAEGRERWAREEAERQQARRAAYSAWVREDARLYRLVLAAREEGDREAEKDALQTWSANRMPELP